MVVGVRFCGPASQLAAHVFGERTNPSEYVEEGLEVVAVEAFDLKRVLLEHVDSHEGGRAERHQGRCAGRH